MKPSFIPSLIPSLGIVLASVLLMGAASASNGPSVLVQTTPVRQGSLPRIATAYGTVQADSSARNTLMAPLAATVAEVHVRVGEEVAKGAPLVTLAPNPQTSALYAQAVSANLTAGDSLRHTQALLDERLATRQQLADAQKAQSDASAALTALRAQGAAGPRTLRAPFRAIVTAVSTSARAIVTEGTPLLDLARPSGLVLLVGVVPDQAAAIAPDDKAMVTPIGGTMSFAGKVVLRGSVVDAGTGLVPVQISLPPGALLPGQTAQAAITTGAVHGYVVPHQAILVDDDGATYVVQVVHDVAKIVHVHVLDAVGDQDAIGGPLDVAAPLVLAGNYQLQDGMQVRLPDPARKSGQ